MSSELTSKLTSLKQLAAQRDTSIRSDLATTPTPLKVFLTLYSKSFHECYIDYNRGGKALLDWLAPIDMKASYLQYSPSLITTYKVPQLFKGYEFNQVAKMLHNKYPEYSFTEIERLMYFTLSSNV